MYARLYDHLNQLTILTPYWYGFRTISSMEKATCSLLLEILLAMNSKNTVGGIFCELQNPFNCVNYNVLLEKLKFYGIKGTFYTLIKSYLEERYQNLTIASSTSNYNIS
jgi:hypothetical protein